jgi:hypothetical protein
MEWRKIEGYENYEVSSSGDVRHGDYIMGKHPNKGGYLQAHMPDKFIKIHRLVALAFIPPIEGKPEVDHINGIRDDNRVENLRWVDKTEQNINRSTFPMSSSGHRCIYPSIRNGLVDGYRVKIERYKVIMFRKWFKTLPEAIESRNNYLE